MACLGVSSVSSYCGGGSGGGGMAPEVLVEVWVVVLIVGGVCV